MLLMEILPEVNMVEYIKMSYSRRGRTCVLKKPRMQSSDFSVGNIRLIFRLSLTD